MGNSGRQLKSALDPLNFGDLGLESVSKLGRLGLLIALTYYSLYY